MAAATEIKAIWVDPTGGAGSTPILKEQASTNRLSDTISQRDVCDSSNVPFARAWVISDPGGLTPGVNSQGDLATKSSLVLSTAGAGFMSLCGQLADGTTTMKQMRSLALVQGANDERVQGDSQLGHLDRFLVGEGTTDPYIWRGAWAASAYATGSVTFATGVGGDPTDGDTVVINDGTTIYTYQYDDTGVQADAGNTYQVDTSAVTTGAGGATALFNTINASPILITATNGTPEVVALTHDNYTSGSTETNNTITADTETVVGMTGGKRTYVSGDVVSNTHSGVEKGYVCYLANDATTVNAPGTGSGSPGDFWRGPDSATPFTEMALRPGANVVFTRHDDHLPPWTEVSASVTGGGGGTLLTGSNIGGGAGVHSPSSTSTDLKLRTHVAVSGETTVDVAGDTIEHGLPTALMNHFNNVGIDHTQLHAANADTGLAGVTAAEIVTHMGGTGARLHDKGTYFCRDWTWETPVAGQSFLLFHTEKAILVGSIEAQVVGSGAQVEIQVYHDIAVNGTATTTNKVLATDPQPVSVNSPQWPTSLTSFSVAAIPAGSMVWITVPVVSGTVDQFFFQMQWTQS